MEKIEIYQLYAQATGDEFFSVEVAAYSELGYVNMKFIRLITGKTSGFDFKGLVEEYDTEVQLIPCDNLDDHAVIRKAIELFTDAENDLRNATNWLRDGNNHPSGSEANLQTDHFIDVA